MTTRAVGLLTKPFCRTLLVAALASPQGSLTDSLRPVRVEVKGHNKNRGPIAAGGVISLVDVSQRDPT